ncbi:MUSK [Mytilus coruscus]|uniref:receptor protein-tyrosine kinase n=1 Tax=Mytilus coruscus TaxID=42192 RepID=A0A6J8CTL9_MYTCO|nr:MUSK [Mytilus coruscus]
MKEFAFLFVVTCVSHLVNSEIPKFLKSPQDVQVELGTTAQLECHATGPPNLVISWQKDGISNFPAIQQKRWHVEPAQSVTFISEVKTIDEGVYSCIATNQNGTVTANATVSIVDNRKFECSNWENEVIPSGQEFAIYKNETCQVCLCNDGSPKNCRKIICPSKCSDLEDDSLCCSKCSKILNSKAEEVSASVSEVSNITSDQSDKESSSPPAIPGKSTPGQSEPASPPQLPQKPQSTSDQPDKSDTEQKPGKTRLQNDAINNNPLADNIDTKTIKQFDHTTNHVDMVKGDVMSNQNSVEDQHAKITTLELIGNKSSVEVGDNLDVKSAGNESSVEVREHLDDKSRGNASSVEVIEQLNVKSIGNESSVEEIEHLNESKQQNLLNQSSGDQEDRNVTEDIVTFELTTTKPITEVPNITCTDWKGKIFHYGEEYAPYKEDNCKLCACGRDSSKQCRTVRIIECPDRNCTYYVWKIGMDCCEYECINDINDIKKGRPIKKPRKKKLEIIKPPKNATVSADYSHTFHCRANKRTNSHHHVLYKWFKDGERIKDRFSRDEDTGHAKYDINKKTGSLKIIHVHVKDRGEYYCKVKHGNETLISHKVFLEVQVPVKFVGLIPYNRTVKCGNPVQLVCNVAGIPVPTMIWSKNGVELGSTPPDGISIYTTVQGNDVLSRLLIKNVTETSRYGCRAYNKPKSPPGKLAIVRQDVQVTMMCSGTKYKPIGQCVPYNGSFCSAEIDSGQIHKIVNVSFEKLDRDVIDMLHDIKKNLNPLSDRCLSNAKKVFCNHVYPSCHHENGEAKPIHMCRQSCLAVKELLCFDAWLMVVHSMDGYKLPICETLPDKLDPTMKCVDIPMFVRKPEETKNSCYKGTGQWYNGTVNTTKSGIACQAWESQNPHNHQRPPDVFPSLEGAENYCRNPGSEEDSPWCYTQDRIIRWERCDVPKCDGEIRIPTGRVEEEKPTMTTEAIAIVSTVTAVGIFVVALICILCYQIFRQRHSIKYNSTPQDDLDIDVDKLQPNISYHKMADIKLNPKLQTLEYPRNDVVYLCDIGQGAFGRVFKAKAKNLIEDSEDCFVAVKMLKDDASEELQQDFEREASLMAEFDHRNIVKLLGICAIGKPMCLLFEFMENGDLNGFLRLCSSESNYIIRRNSVDKKSSELFHHVGTNQQMNIIMQICTGMVYLSDNGYVHRDLATRNCLVGENLIVKISDFGLARSVHSMEYYKGSDHDAIPIRWMPLESILYNKFTSESDVWSFGIVLWEVFSYALQPYYGMSHEEVVQFIKDGKVLACPDKTPKALYELMRLCWSKKPTNRPRFIHLCKSLHAINEEIQKKSNISEVV